MARTPDRSPGAMIEDEEIRFISNASGPTVPGAFNYDGTEFVMRDAMGNFNPRSSAGAFTTSGSIVETTFTASFPSGLSGSLTRLADGSSYIRAGENISISTGSSGEVTISSAVALSAITQLSGDVMAGPGTGSQAASVVSIRGNAISSDSPSTGKVMTWNGSSWSPELLNLIAGLDILVTTNASGQVTIAASRKIPTITSGTSSPSGGSSGDIYLQFT